MWEQDRKSLSESLQERYARSSDTKGDSSSIRQNPTACRASCSNLSRILQLGWRPTIPLDQGLSQTYRWFLDQRELQTVYLRRTRRSNCAPYAKPTSNVPAAETPRIILSAEATSPVTTNEPRLYPM